MTRIGAGNGEMFLGSRFMQDVIFTVLSTRPVVQLSFATLHLPVGLSNTILNEPRYEKTGFLHIRKQSRRSASR